MLIDHQDLEPGNAHLLLTLKAPPHVLEWGALRSWRFGRMIILAPGISIATSPLQIKPNVPIYYLTVSRLLLNHYAS